MKKKHSTIAILLCVFLLMSLTACTRDKPENDSFTNDSSVSEHSFQTSEDVISYLRENGRDLGFNNALSEINFQSSTTYDGDTFVRMQQYYKGIPVWGRGAVCVIDESGKETALVGNCVDIPEIDTSVTAVTKQSLEDSLRSYCTTKLGCSNECVYIFDVPEETQQCIYIDENSTAHLAYTMLLRLQDKEEREALEVLVNVNDCSVLLARSILISDNEATGSLAGQRNTYSDVTYSQENGTYTLYDARRDITSYVANSETPFDWEYILDFLAGSAHKEVWDQQSETVVSWDANFFPDAISVDAYVNTQITYDFFDVVLQNQSTDGSGGAAIKIITDVQYSGGDNIEDNAYSSSGETSDGKKETHLVFGNARNGDYVLSAYLDTVAHEYMHGVESFHSGMIYQGESGAIMEALSDIFGEIVEAWYSGNRSLTGVEPDWVHNIGRNLKDPESSNNPNRVGGANWISPTDTQHDMGGRHNNSTVISHSAYLMWNGGADGAKNKKVSLEQLAKVWYRAMLMMPSDCSFSTCRTLVELAAESVGLTEMQLQCVSESFDAVGISGDEIADYDLTSDATLAVYDANENLCGNYTMLISGWTVDAEDLPTHIRDTGNAIIWFNNHKVSYSETREIGEAAEIPIDLKVGTYTIRLIDRSEINNSVSFSINACRSNGKNKLELHTGFNRGADYSNLVTDVYAEQKSYTGFSGASEVADYHIPKINIESPEIDALNKAIYDEWYNDIQYSLSRITQYGVPSIGYLTYSWHINGDILCLLLEAQWPGDDDYIGNEIYNILISAKREASSEEIISASGKTQEEYTTLVQQALGSAFLDFAYDYKDSLFIGSQFSDYYQETISPDNIAAAKPFINEDGHICILGKYFIPAGGGSVDCIIDLEAFILSPYFGKDFGASNNEDSTEEVAGNQTRAQLESSIVGEWREESSIVTDHTFKSDGTYSWWGMGSGSYYIEDDLTLVINFLPQSTYGSKDIYLWFDGTFKEFHSTSAHSDYHFWYFTEYGVLKLDGTAYFRDGVGDHRQSGPLMDSLVGSWLGPGDNEFVIHSDGTYEENYVIIIGGKVHFRDSTGTVAGTVEITGSNTATLWQTVSGFGAIPIQTEIIYDSATDTLNIYGNIYTREQ